MLWNLSVCPFNYWEISPSQLELIGSEDRYSKHPMEIIGSEKLDIQKSFIIFFTFNVFSYWFVHIQFVLRSNKYPFILGLFIYLWCPFFTLMRIRISIRILILLRKLCESATAGLQTLKGSFFEPPRPSTAPFEPQSSWMLTLIRIQIRFQLFSLMRIRIRIQLPENNSDACGSGSATLTGIMQDYVPCTSFISKINKSVVLVANFGCVSWWYEWLILWRRVA